MSSESDPRVLELLAWLDEISDGDVERFADCVANMPAAQMQWLIRSWPRLRSLQPKAVLGGAVRPFVGPTFNSGARVGKLAAALLLYVDQAAVASYVLLPTLQPERVSRSLDAVQDNLSFWRHRIRATLLNINDLRPLIEGGSLILMPRVHPQALWAEMSTLQTLWPELDFDVTDDYFLVSEPHQSLEWSMANAFRVFMEEFATPLDLDFWSRSESSLASTKMFDARSRDAAKLMTLTAPRFDLCIKDLIALREDSMAITLFRSSLQDSLTSFTELPTGLTGIEGARKIVADRLRHDLAAVLKESRRSPLLSAATAATRRFAFVGLGASAGAAMAISLSAPIVGAVTGAAGGASVALAESIRETLNSRRSRRPGKAIEAVITAFEE